MRVRNSRTELARLVELLEKVGPNVNEIARISGQYKETVRYRYREKILNKGFGLQARPNHERLGLKRIILVADLNQDYLPQTGKLFTRLNGTAYVASYYRTLTEGVFVISASVPAEFVGKFREFVRELQSRGVFAKTKLLVFDWFRNLGMNAEFYDFDKDRWELDWQKLQKLSSRVHAIVPAGRATFDYLDLLVLKELQVDATRSLTEIAGKLHISYKRLLRHYRHLLERDLMHGYRTLWIRTRYDASRDYVMKSKHRYLFLDLLAANLTLEESLSLMTNVHRIPFLWAEAGGRHYFAQIAIPLEYVSEVLQYLRSSVQAIKERVNFYLGDQDDALGFSISYQLYDQSSRTWTFDPAKAFDEIEKILPRLTQQVNRSPS